MVVNAKLERVGKWLGYIKFWNPDSLGEPWENHETSWWVQMVPGLKFELGVFKI